MKSQGPGSPNYAQDADVSPDGKTLYVSRGYVGDVAAFDIASGRMLWNRALNTSRADHMALTPDGRSLFVSAMLDNRVYRISTDKGEITGHFVSGIYPHDNQISRDGRRVSPELTLIATIPVGDAPGWAETADAGRLCLVANTRSDDLSIISIATRAEIRRLPIGDGPKYITITKLPAAVVAAAKARQ